MNWKVVAFICLMSAVIQTRAQSSDSTASETLHFYLTGQVALPSEEFRKIVDNSIANLAIGVNCGLVLSPFGKRNPTPVLIGIDFGYLNYGVDKTPASAVLPALKTTYDVITWNGQLRLRPTYHRANFVPFLDGLLGVKILNTTTKIDKDFTNIILNTNQPEVLNRVNNTGLNYGLGIGFNAYSNKAEYLGFTMRLLYLWGDDIKYVVRHSLAVDSNGYITYQTGMVNTSMLTLQIGLNVAWIRNIVSQAH